VEEADAELIHVRAEMEWAQSEAAEHKAEAGRAAAEIEGLRERLQEAQRELGIARAELEAARAEHAQGAAVSERRGSEADRLRSQLESAKAEAERLRIELENAPAAPAPAAEHLPEGDQVVDAEVAAEELDGPSEQEIRRALEEDRFELHAQPVLDLHTNETSQYELLIRMVGEDGRLLLPQAFLRPARRAGLAHAIDRWVVTRAIRMLADIPGNVRLEVNLSPEAINDPDLPAVIDQELAATPVDPGRLILEVTGQTALEELDATRTLSQRVRGLGCHFALDDFRSTFGSFRLLKDLALDYLKLDGELVGSLAESRTSQLIVKALVDVASGTGMKTVAVFVSDRQTLEMLRQQGVDYAQGYTVGRPRPVADSWPGDAPAALPAGS
jgi:EAL domain-containing protein (putative c-di-GMP-specific phosphodiesterase class I)